VRLFQRECAEEWTDESGRLLLMGEAAHPLYVSHMSSEFRSVIIIIIIIIRSLAFYKVAVCK
jgi:hypothetical protein